MALILVIDDDPGSGVSPVLGQNYLNLAKELGACRTLEKPFSMTALLNTVTEVLDGSAV